MANEAATLDANAAQALAAGNGAPLNAYAEAQGGTLTPEGKARAVKAGQLACKAGHVRGCYLQAHYLMAGGTADKTDEQLRLGRWWADKGCVAGHGSSCFAAGRLAASRRDFNVAAYMLEQGCNVGHAQACAEGVRYFDANNDVATARALARKACDLKIESACARADSNGPVPEAPRPAPQVAPPVARGGNSPPQGRPADMEYVPGCTRTQSDMARIALEQALQSYERGVQDYLLKFREFASQVQSGSLSARWGANSNPAFNQRSDQLGLQAGKLGKQIDQIYVDHRYVQCLVPSLVQGLVRERATWNNGPQGQLPRKPGLIHYACDARDLSASRYYGPQDSCVRVNTGTPSGR